MNKLKLINKFSILIIFFICIIFSLIFGNIDESIENNYGIIITISGLVLLFLSFVILDKTKKLKLEYIKIFIFGILFFVYIGYILNTNCGTRQHDTRSLDWQYGGHLGYIGYILENLKLPDFNPIEKWCFSNPPLFYIVSAIFVKFQNLIGRDGYLAIENLQYLTVSFALIFNLYVYRILEILDIKKIKYYIVLFVGLSPAIVYLSGSLNNDILSIMLSTMAIYYTIKWYKNIKIYDLLKIALAISFAIMTKINSAIIAFPIGIIFFIKLIKERGNFKKYILYYFIFAIIALPIGLWFPVKNLIKYNIPITYVQTVVEKEENPGYIGNKDVFERFFKIDKEHLQTVNLKFEKGKSDYNILISTLKSFIVDEQIDYSQNLLLQISIYAMFFINIIMIVLFIISFCKNQIKVEDIFLYMILIFEFAFYIKFCFEYPYAFSMNFRYIVLTIIPIMVSISKYAQNNKWINNILQNSIYLYTILSIIFFINL